MLLNFQDVSIGENPNIDSSLAVNSAGEGAVSWATRLAGEEVRTEIISSLALQKGA